MQSEKQSQPDGFVPIPLPEPHSARQSEINIAFSSRPPGMMQVPGI